MQITVRNEMSNHVKTEITNDKIKDVILLDTGATFSSVMNKDIITDIKKAEIPIVMRTNVGTRQINKTGQIPGFNGKM